MCFSIRSSSPLSLIVLCLRCFGRGIVVGGVKFDTVRVGALRFRRFDFFFFDDFDSDSTTLSFISSTSDDAGNIVELFTSSRDLDVAFPREVICYNDGDGDGDGNGDGVEMKIGMVMGMRMGDADGDGGGGDGNGDWG